MGRIIWEPDQQGLSHQRMSIRWVSGCGSSVPSNAVPGGVDRGTRLFVARASHAGSLVPGKLHPTYETVFVSYGGKEHTKGSGFEILTGEGFQWKAAENGRVPEGAVQAGHEANGTPLYVARAKVDGVDSIGKVNTSHNDCHLPYGGREHRVRRYGGLVHFPTTTVSPRQEVEASSGVSGWGLLGLAAGAVAVGAAAAVVSSLNNESDSDSSSDSDNADPTAVDKEDADLAEAIRQSLLLHRRPPSPSTPPHDSASAAASSDGASASVSASADPQVGSSSSSSLPAPECIVCWNSLNPPQRIHHCVNGHFVCDDCRPQLQKCSLCRANFAGRATGMEQFLRELHKKP